MSESIPVIPQIPSGQVQPDPSAENMTSGSAPRNGGVSGGFPAILSSMQGNMAIRAGPDPNSVNATGVSGGSDTPSGMGGNLLPQPAPNTVPVLPVPTAVPGAVPTPVRGNPTWKVLNAPLPIDIASAVDTPDASLPVQADEAPPLAPNPDRGMVVTSGIFKPTTQTSVVPQGTGEAPSENTPALSKLIAENFASESGVVRFQIEGSAAFASVGPDLNSFRGAEVIPAPNTGAQSLLNGEIFTTLNEFGAQSGAQPSISPLLSPASNAGPGTAHMGSVNFNGQQFGPDLDRQIMWLAQNKIQVAQLRLNPPNLGPLEVRISMNNTEASVQFVSAYAGVREALEIAVPRLRESLADLGLSLTNTSVSDHSRQRDDSTGHRAADSSVGHDLESPNISDLESVSRESAAALGVGLISVYA